MAVEMRVLVCLGISQSPEMPEVMRGMARDEQRGDAILYAFSNKRSDVSNFLTREA